MEAEHPALAALIVVLDGHTDHGPDPSEGVDHDPHQGPVPESYNGTEVGAIQQVTGLVGGQDRVLPWRTMCLGPRTALAGLTSRPILPATSQLNS